MLIFDVWEGITFPWQSILCSLSQFSEFFSWKQSQSERDKRTDKIYNSETQKNPCWFLIMSHQPRLSMKGKHWIYLHMIVSRTFINLASLQFTLFNIFTTWYFKKHDTFCVYFFLPPPHPITSPSPSIDYKCTKGRGKDLTISTFLRVSILVSHMQKAPINVDELNRTNLSPPFRILLRFQSYCSSWNK